MKLISVNLGKLKPMTIAQDSLSTGIFKEQVAAPVFISRQGLEGDLIGDTRNHGGVDQAVYLYSEEDYAYWQAQLGYKPEAGTFGENLTVSSFGSEPIRVGDRFRVGEVELELTAPRIPCSKLATRMNDLGFVKTFRQAGRPGAYARVLKEGMVSTGNTVEKTFSSPDYPTIAQFFDLWYVKELSKAQLEHLLASPIAERARGFLETKLEQLS